MGKCKCEHWQSCPECTSALRLAQIEIERLTQRNDELRTANGFAHTLEQARIWDGMKWHWNINATACQRAWKILDAALAAKGERCRQRNR